MGLTATAAHYCVLVILVQLFAIDPVPATLVGFTIGGVLSYSLNRKHTFASIRPHGEAVWRFFVVASVAFALTFIFMRTMVDRWHWPYLFAQVITTGLVMIWTFGANRFWTFGDKA